MRRRELGTTLSLVLAASACACAGADDGQASASATTSDVGSGSAGGDALPPAPALISPADSAAEVSTQVELCWSPVVDPDGEAVRYRVFVDETELTKGILGDEIGWPGPCVGPLDLNFETSYTWSVEAFEVDDPARRSPRSPTWRFTTKGDGLSGTVFEDRFDDDLGWEVSGDAIAGAWIRGMPAPALDGDAPSQPARCDRGGACMFTGQNPVGIADAEDVAGGATILTSPAFDLEGAAAASVRLRRFFYKSEAGATSSLKVELLTPDADLPGGYAVHELERLDQASDAAPENRWTPREYLACGLPMLPGSRLRITATDTGAGILEAAIDNVSVHAHADSTICGDGAGSGCDPDLGAAACADPLLCCAQGVVNEGVHRCEVPVAGLDFASPPATPEAPGNGPLGCPAPDLIVDPLWIDPIFTVIDVGPETCELFEDCVGGLGERRLLLFTAATPNVGAIDLVMGIPANQPELFHYSACHDHYHFDEFARYELLDSEGAAVVAVGHKQAFCMLDTVSWAWPNEVPRFDCANQGISRGFTDSYDAGLPCQWVDITGVPAGDYVLRITLNRAPVDAALPILVERDYGNNVLEVAVVVP